MAPRQPRLIHEGVDSTVILRCPAGHELVRRCYPLRTLKNGDVEPFPTLYWLTCPQVTAMISRLEHGGLITDLQERLAGDTPFFEAVSDDHRHYIDARRELLTAGDFDRVRERAWWPGFQLRGIGGIRNWRSVKCLHLHYAHHLAVGSTIGRVVDHVGQVQLCHKHDTDSRDGSSFGADLATSPSLGHQ